MFERVICKPFSRNSIMVPICFDLMMSPLAVTNSYIFGQRFVNFSWLLQICLDVHKLSYHTPDYLSSIWVIKTWPAGYGLAVESLWSVVKLATVALA